MGFEVLPFTEIERAHAVFVGGGNTFRLLKTLYERSLLDDIRRRVRAGLSYIGSSAGSVLSSPTIRTTNDMPIVFPPTLDSLGIIPFQLNCHYLDVDRNSTHQGETREERIREFHEEHATPVVGLREGTCLGVEGGVATLLGRKSARIFLRGRSPFEVEPGTRIDEVAR
jgi:dipeptidase E